MNLKYIFLLALFIIQGCDNESSDIDQQDTLNLIQDSRSIWIDSGIDSYTFTYFVSPNDCPQADPYPPVEITVINGAISSIYVPDFDLYKDVENTPYPTVNTIFENMIESVSKIKGIPSFDSAFGYPKSYTTDLSDKECDGHSVSVSSFI